MADNSAALQRARRRDSRTKRQRAAETIEAMAQTGEPITFPNIPAEHKSRCRCSTQTPISPPESPTPEIDSVKPEHSEPGDYPPDH